MESFGDDYIVHDEELVHVRKDAVSSPNGSGNGV